MKKTRAFAATAIAFTLLAGAPAAWAGSGASVLQTGDLNYSIVKQNKKGTSVETWTATNTLERFKSERKVMKAVQRGGRPATSGSKLHGNSCSTFFNGGNLALATQNGFGNSAYASQQGSNNLAGSIQDGQNNKSYVIQKGNGHEALAEQYGNSNTSAIIQRC
ncbi:hypothetical protein [Parvibaculum sp.]|uniref:hypothetical protein n=1 Tax=Parvibaculum sp. TaxID=2024848 RepID=UPI003297983E